MARGASDTPPPDRYAVVGNPVAHSRSPLIHARFARVTAQNMTYEALLAPYGRFAATVAAFLEAGGVGFNVTVPFKEEAWKLAAVNSPRAEAARAVNTVWKDGAVLHGDNTDGVGLVADLRRHGVVIGGAEVLLLGAGGAARGVVGPLLAQRPARLLIANRTAAKAVALADDFIVPRGCVLHGGGMESIAPRQPERGFDLIINATSAGLSNSVPRLPLTALQIHGCCYDMVYAEAATAFQRWARAAGADLALDGLGMLVEQAAESFFVWRGVRPPVDEVIRELRDSKNN